MTIDAVRRLAADEAAGRPHASETSKSIDAYGRAVVSTPQDCQGRIIITWPKPVGVGVPLTPWSMTIHDYDTGEQILAITGLRLSLGGEQWDTEIITAELTELVDEDGKPQHGERVRPVQDPDDPERIRTGVFRYYVAEMRIAE